MNHSEISRLIDLEREKQKIEREKQRRSDAATRAAEAATRASEAAARASEAATREAEAATRQLQAKLQTMQLTKQAGKQRCGHPSRVRVPTLPSQCLLLQTWRRGCPQMRSWTRCTRTPRTRRPSVYVAPPSR